MFTKVMSSYRSHESRQPADTMRPAPFTRRNDRDDRFYDDHRSRSRSRDRRYSSPPRRRSPPHGKIKTGQGPEDNNINTDLHSWKDISRSPPRGPATKVGRNGNHHGWDRSRDRQYDRGYGNRPRSSPSPRRGRGSYRDRDREGYKSSSYSRSRSRSRSSHEERPQRIAAPPNKEIMMEGLATDMTEEDVRSFLPFLPQPVHHWPNQFDTCLET